MEVGTILYSSWGYDQTNVNFFQVVRATAKTVYIREIEGKKTNEGDMHGTVVALKDQFTKWSLLNEANNPVARRVKNIAGQLAINVSGYNNAYIWDGKPKSFSTWA